MTTEPSDVLDGIIDRHERAVRALTEPLLGRVSNYGPEALQLLLRSFYDIPVLIEMVRDLESTIETMEIAADPEVVRQLEEAEADIREGRVTPLSEVISQMETSRRECQVCDPDL